MNAASYFIYMHSFWFTLSGDSMIPPSSHQFPLFCTATCQAKHIYWHQSSQEKDQHNLSQPLYLRPTWKIPHRSTPPLMFYFLLHPENIIKLLYEGIIPAHSQCGALSCYESASDIERDDIIISLKENLI